MASDFSIFLTIPDVIGSSQSKDHPKAIELLTCNNTDHYPSNLHDITLDSARQQQPVYGKYMITKKLDMSSNSLRRSLWQGEILSKAKIEVVMDHKVSLTIEFKEVLLQTLTMSITSSQEPQENISFTYGEVKYLHSHYKTDGSKRGDTTAEIDLTKE